MNFWQINGDIRLKMLNKLMKEKLVDRRTHPDHPLFVYNYTPAAMHIPPAEWPLHPGLSQARGLVLDLDGNVVMRSFEKSWGLETLREIGDIRTDQIVSIHEKFDGYLIVARYWEGNLIVASRGSFESEHAQKAKRMLLDAPWIHHLQIDNHYTFVFELLWHERPVVVEHDKDELVLLAAFEGVNEATGGAGEDMETMLDWWNGGMHGNKEVPMFACAISECHYERLDTEIKNLVEEGVVEKGEGFMLVFSDGYRAKWKTPEYQEAHRIMRLSTKALWRSVVDNDVALWDKITKYGTPGFREWVRVLLYEWTKQSEKFMAWAEQALGAWRESSNPDKSRRALAKFVNEGHGTAIWKKLIFLLADEKVKEAKDAAFRLTKPTVATFYTLDDEN
jgi:hypothetical protein